MTEQECPCCGADCRVVGSGTTQHYEPLDRERLWEVEQERDRLLVLVAKLWHLIDWIPPMLRETVFRQWTDSEEKALANAVKRGRALVEGRHD